MLGKIPDLSPMELLLIGGGAHARSIIDMLRSQGGVNVVGVVNAYAPRESHILDVPVLGDLSELASMVVGLPQHAVLAIDDNGGRMNAAQRVTSLMPGIRFPSLVHSKAMVGGGVTIGQGSVVMGGAFVEVGTVIGEHVIIGANCSIGPGSSLGGFVTVHAGACIAESCHIGSGCSIGMNASLVKRMIIGTHSVVGPGSVVLESVPDLHVAVGSPARCVRTRLVGEPYL